MGAKGSQRSNSNHSYLRGQLNSAKRQRPLHMPMLQKAAKNRSYFHFAIVAEDKCGTFKMDSSWCCALVRHQVNPCSYLYIVLYNHVQSNSFQNFYFSSVHQFK